MNEKQFLNTMIETIGFESAHSYVKNGEKI